MSRTRTLRTAMLLALAIWSLAPQARAADGLIVIELFQAQGCSSCPPADANVNALSERDDVLALNFAVTYWDKLGWRDTFARPEFTTRQRDYARGLRHVNVYTPQVVLNGRQDLPGVDRGKLDLALSRAGRVPTLSLQGARVFIREGMTPPRPADVWLVRYDTRTLQVAISAGENDGLTVPHKNIVRELVRLGAWSGDAQSYRIPPASNAGLKTAIILQNPDGGPIIAAVKD